MKNNKIIPFLLSLLFCNLGLAEQSTGFIALGAFSGGAGAAGKSVTALRGLFLADGSMHVSNGVDHYKNGENGAAALALATGILEIYGTGLP